MKKIDKTFIKRFLKPIFSPISFLFNRSLQFNNVVILWRRGQAIGDQVLMAGVARSFSLKGISNIIVINNPLKVDTQFILF